MISRRRAETSTSATVNSPESRPARTMPPMKSNQSSVNAAASRARVRFRLPRLQASSHSALASSLTSSSR